MRDNRYAVRHIALGGRALCRPDSMTAAMNSADCVQCNRKIDNLVLAAVELEAAEAQGDRTAVTRHIDTICKWVVKNGITLKGNE